MSTQQPKRRSPGCLVFLLAIAALVVYSAIRYSADLPGYLAAHNQYIKGDCASALPLFERLSAAFRPVDFGRLGELSQLGERECKAYLAAAAHGISGYFEFATINYPDSPLTGFARKAAMDEITQISAETAELDKVCAQKETLAQNGWIPHPDATLQRFDYVCATRFLDAGEPGTALSFMLDELNGYPNSIYAAWTIGEISTRNEICYALDKIVLYPVIMNHVELYPHRLRECGEYFLKNGDYGRAVAVFDSFLINYPLRPEVNDVKKSDALALVELAKTMPAWWIRAPEGSGYGTPGIASLVLQNDSPHKIRIVLVGPEVRLAEMDLCGGCSDYRTMAPVWCPGKGPKETFEVKPGEYHVLIQPLGEAGVPPSVGDWVLGDRNTYYTCYFVAK